MALKYIVEGAKDEGADVELIDLNDYMMPIYSEDIEKKGKPESVIKLKEKLSEAQGLIICAPEYNHSIPGGLKNVIDWLSRFKDQPFKGKWIALAGASTSAAGTIRSQLALLPVFRVLTSHVLPTQIYLSSAQTLFDDNGNLKDEVLISRLNNLGKELAQKLK